MYGLAGKCGGFAQRRCQPTADNEGVFWQRILNLEGVFLVALLYLNNKHCARGIVPKIGAGLCVFGLFFAAGGRGSSEVVSSDPLLLLGGRRNARDRQYKEPYKPL